MSNEKQADMSKLSTSLKALINAPFAKPGPRPAPKQVQELYEAIANDAAIRNLGPKSWLTVSPTSQNIDEALARGRGLWDSIYRPYEDKLFEKLALAHPDLPVYILSSHYSALLSDPPASQRDTLASLGRVHTSMIAISCLRAQTGVGPQVLSHVFGLRKALEDGSYKNDQDGESEEAVQYLASDEGGHWILNTVDKIVEAIGGSSFAPGRDSKL
ncbi:hypothetical protein FPRO05_02421 [Fusarium proliferatum]|uniref:Dol-P-Man:Man(5)GlcNAc(2)-PP-Dol alpha-1,3-mannosyltransferase n=1 Tax=Gibberella intermedia TaxID=948311 RepID=A0A365MZ38_GIBIN|nr:hypothetical protein FPRO05_02421 [Fusarium proliferatum]